MRGANQKLKLLYLMKILLKDTDEQHPMPLNDIKEKLNAYGISAERKSLYDDLESLRVFGLDIERTSGKNCGYYIAGRDFELAELKLMVDAVQSSKFITAKKSSELIKKVESLASIYDAQLLQRQVYVANRVKTMNESIYYNIDAIHNAIAQGKNICFRYFEWILDFTANERIQKRYRKNGDFYEISPWALTWDDENYYLIAYDAAAEKIKHYRVDKMDRISISTTERKGKKAFDSFDIPSYARMVFGMFSGEEEKMKLRFENSLIGVVIDRFGKNVFLTKDDDEHFTITENIIMSPQFCGWLSSFGDGAKIISPKKAIATFCEHIKKLNSQYKE